MDYLYDLGYRRKDFVLFLSGYMVGVDNFKESDPELYQKRSEFVTL
jgi:hypothetical protein